MLSYDEYLQLFRKAKKESTLAVMVEAQANKLKVTFNPSIRSYAAASRDYSDWGNTEAVDMFGAAFQREQEIIDSKAPSITW